MAHSAQPQRECVAQVAGRILIAGRNGQLNLLARELEHARTFAAQWCSNSTLEMERMEALSQVVEALHRGYSEQSGAVRLLEQLATAPAIRTGALLKN